MKNPITKSDMEQAKNNWAQAVINQDVETLLGLYSSEANLKPTLSNSIRNSRDDIKAYFIGSENFNEDGFLKKNFVKVNFDESHPQVVNGVGVDMGLYTFSDAENNSVSAHYTFVYEKSEDGKVLIIAHHSSLTI